MSATRCFVIMAFQINKHFGLETRRYNTDGDPERDAAFVDPYPHGDYLKEIAAQPSPSPSTPPAHEHNFVPPPHDDEQQCDTDCRERWHKCSICKLSRDEVKSLAAQPSPAPP